MRLKNKVAIITGSASGFGKGIAKKFTDEGANLIMVDLNSKLLKKVSKNLSQDYFIADVSKSSSFKSLSGYVYKKYKKLETDELDESFFPIIWTKEGYRTNV